MEPFIKLGIIGTAGRKDDEPLLSKSLYDNMVKVGDIVRLVLKSEYLVSGGAAYADHVAVKLFLDGGGNLSLHLPAEFKNGKFVDNGDADYKNNPGKTANYYHRKFSEKCGINSLGEIEKAIENGAKVVVTPGFMNRNSKVAEESDAILAMTFGDGCFLKDGGTQDTVRKYLSKIEGQKKADLSYHFDLSSKSLFGSAKIESAQKETKIVNMRKDSYDVYIGRSTKEFHFGNPFGWLEKDLAKIKVKDRDTAIDCFERWLIGDEKWIELEPERRLWILDNILSLRGKTLGCFCHPERCHGEVYIKLINILNERKHKIPFGI